MKNPLCLAAALAVAAVAAISSGAQTSSPPSGPYIPGWPGGPFSCWSVVAVRDAPCCVTADGFKCQLYFSGCDADVMARLPGGIWYTVAVGIAYEAWCTRQAATVSESGECVPTGVAVAERFLFQSIAGDVLCPM